MVLAGNGDDRGRTIYRLKGGVNLDVPEGSDGRTGVGNSVTIWRCWWPDAYDGSER